MLLARPDLTNASNPAMIMAHVMTGNAPCFALPLDAPRLYHWTAFVEHDALAESRLTWTREDDDGAAFGWMICYEEFSRMCKGGSHDLPWAVNYWAGQYQAGRS